MHEFHVTESFIGCQVHYTLVLEPFISLFGMTVSSFISNDTSLFVGRL